VKLGERNATIFSAVESNASWIVDNGNAQEIANTAWACAKLDVQSPLLFRSIDERSAWLAENGKPQHVSNTAWACATLNVQAPSFFRSIEERASWIVDNGNAQEIANTAWACAKLDVQSPSLFRSIDERSAWLVENGKPQNISNTAWAFAKLRFHAPSLFCCIDERSAWLIENGNPQNVANAALAFAEVGIRPEQLFRCLLEEGGRLEQFLEGANSQEVCNLAWSVATLGLESDHDASLLLALWGAALRDHAEEMTADNLRQLAQVYVHARASGVALSPALPPALKARMIHACQDTTKESSKFEAEYSQLLSEIGFEHEREVSPFVMNSSSSGDGSSSDGGGDGSDDDEDFGKFLAIDMACQKLKVAVEYDGDSHFLTKLTPGAKENYGKRNGRTAAKRRLLQQLGWRVVNVPFFDNILLESKEFIEKQKKLVENGGGKKALKKIYLKGKLAKVGVVI